MKNSENLTLRDSNKYMDSLSFSSLDAKSLQGAEKWEHIPDFCVLTGPNGSGKSHLLEYASRCLQSKEGTRNLPGRHIYLPANHDEMLPSYHHDQTKDRDLNEFWAEISSQRKSDESLNFLRERFTHGKYLRDEKTEKIDKFLEDLRKIFRKKRENSDADQADEFADCREAVRENNEDVHARQYFDILVEKHFPYFISGTPGDKSISLLNSILQSYHTQIDKYQRQKIKLSELLDYARQNKSEIFPGYSDDLEMLDGFQRIEDEVEKKYIASKIQEELGRSPLKEINDILRDHKFTFEIKESKDGIRLIRTNIKDFPEIEPKDLSSGEKKILEMLGWFYYHLSDKIFEGRKVSIMLLDEPDRHLDPELLVVFLDIIFNKFVKSKKKVQVLMTTHRPDTITLVPEEYIFLVQRDQNSSQIVRASRNSVLRRLTQNLQNYTRTSTKVYTEGTTDADFYCGAYYSLLSSRNKSPIDQKELIFRDNKGNEIPKSLFSREYPLLFVPSSHVIGEGGGYNSVYTCVLRDKNILVSKSKEKQDKIEPISDPQAFNSLGLIDNDNNQHEKEVVKKQLDKRVAFPKVRYSIENFAIDPIILCQVLTPEEASGYINCLVEKTQSSKNEKVEERKAPETGNSGASNTTRETIVSEKRKNFCSICEKIKKELDKVIQDLEASEDSNIDIQNLQNYLQEYFGFIAPIYEKDLSKDSSKNQKKQSLCSNFEETYDKILKKIENQEASGMDVEWVRTSFNELSKSFKPILDDYAPKGQKIDTPKLPEGNEKVNILILKGLNKFITVEYPLKFLKMNGHDLVLGLNPFVEQNSKLIQEIANNVYTSGLTFIQEELADVILKLNQFAENN